MPQIASFLRTRYGAVHGAEPRADYRDYQAVYAGGSGLHAVLGLRSAAAETLFLERYLDGPVEAAVSTALGRAVSRNGIVEIGCLASDRPQALVALWLATARRLNRPGLVAVATLTRPLHRMLSRIGVPLAWLADADPARLPDAPAWGRYFDLRPAVYAAEAAAGYSALKDHFARRPRREGQG
jgi:hypothetical protein